jgi:hypothetical protein
LNEFVIDRAGATGLSGGGLQQDGTLRGVRPVPTAPVAAGSLIVGFGIAVATGSRALGGVALLVGGVWCIRQWTRRHGPATAVSLAGAGLAAFAVSHLLAGAIGAWPSVLAVAAAMAVAVWARADVRRCSR